MATLAVKLQPGAAMDRIDGWDVDASGRRILKVRVRARPVDGAANEALIRFLANSLDLPKSAVALTRGGQSRLKMIGLDGLDDAELLVRIEERLSGV
ncbi:MULTISPECIES: DUF167 domain-containing protein [unclassified Brevundimonas]|mgnify:CR=1 FL=1|uniref:DUF167 domain-containing protein n=1 Tax=unclassified Brevundimonas TaxID=2622653 RepID=UPI000E87BAEA|nr:MULTISPECIES: DUF167 domain-containing protein [unclassified Brevundimonas]MCK6105759.1 DUF167 domain-containing protein [Brevundimonas sp. EYE_349]HBI18913.1 hypothetical protein [Brevundimonas sp.]